MFRFCSLRQLRNNSNVTISKPYINLILTIGQLREALTTTLGIETVRGLNQIVDMNQTSKFTISFKFILEKLYFDLEVIDFVSEVRHSIIHKNLPSSENILTLACLILVWGFDTFWRPLVFSNFDKLSGRRIVNLSTVFFSALPWGQKSYSKFVGASGGEARFPFNRKFFEHEDFQKNLGGLLALKEMKKKRKSKKNIDLDGEKGNVIVERDPVQKLNSELFLCLNPNSNLRNR